MTEADIEEYYERPLFVPDARISGDFTFFLTGFRGKNFSGTVKSENFQDIKLNFRSAVHRNVSLNLEIVNEAYFPRASRGFYAPLNPDERRAVNEAGASNNNLKMGQGFLEYNHNPSANLRFGLQELNLGDQKGLIFKGRAYAISQNCGIGTWCFNLGVARVGESEANNLTWMSLFYPVYENGVKINSKFEQNQEQPESGLHFKFYRVFYSELNTVQAKFGGSTWFNGLVPPAVANPPLVIGDPIPPDDADPAADYYVFNNAPVFVDRKKEYVGFNLDWWYYNTYLGINYIQFGGQNIYKQFVGAVPTGLETSLGQKKASGQAVNLQSKLLVGDSWRFGLGYFSASGTREDDAQAERDRPPWEKDQLGFYSINKGTFGDANIYFSGTEGYGLGHSVNNLNYANFSAQYYWRDDNTGVEINLYSFKHNFPVYYTNLTGQTLSSKDIGREINLELHYMLEETLELELQLNAFYVSPAYVENDNHIPFTDSNNTTQAPQEFSNVTLGLAYTF